MLLPVSGDRIGFWLSGGCWVARGGEIDAEDLKEMEELLRRIDEMGEEELKELHLPGRITRYATHLDEYFAVYHFDSRAGAGCIHYIATGQEWRGTPVLRMCLVHGVLSREHVGYGVGAGEEGQEYPRN